jgi:benzoylformate decarboxylase
VLSEVKPEDAVLVEESPSNLAELHRWWSITRPDSFFTFASGGLGWNLPASVGIALGERATGRNRPVVAVIGDGTFQYSVQSLWTAAQHKLPILFIVLCNGEYCILKSFAALQGTPGVPGLDIPNLDIVSIARGYGCRANRASTRTEKAEALKTALLSDGTTVLEIPISPEVPR